MNRISVDPVVLVDKHIELSNKIGYLLYTDKEIGMVDIHQIKRLEKLLSIKNSTVYSWLSRSDSSQQMEDAKNYVIELYADKKCERYINKIERLNKKNIYNMDGSTIEFSKAKCYQVNECSHTVRDEIDMCCSDINDKINYQKYLSLKKTNEIFLKIKGVSYLNSYLSSLKNLQTQIKNEISIFLKETEDQYMEYLEYYARKYLPPKRAIQKSDLSYIYHNADENKYFMNDKLKLAAKHIIDLFTICNPGLSDMINIDIIENEKRLERSFCSKIEIPKQIKSVIFQTGGYQDAVNMLHEIGHLLNNICINEEQTVINRRFVNTALDEAYAILFESLVANEYWLSSSLNIDMSTVNNIAEFVRFSNLQTHRKMCGLLLYEFEIYTKEGLLLDYNSCKEKYVMIMNNAYKTNVSPSECFQNIDARCYCYSYVKGAEVAKSLEKYLVEKYGIAWFKNENAGRFLISLWNNIDSHLDLKRVKTSFDNAF